MDDANLRQVALSQAAHDFRGQVAAEEVVKRASVYYGFLRYGSATDIPVKDD